MDRGDKRSFGGSAVDEYVYSESDHQSMEDIPSYLRPFFYLKPNEDLDFNIKMAALKASPSVVSLVSFSGEVVIFQGSGTIIETEGNDNFVLTSLNLIRQPTDEYDADDNLADNLKVVIHVSYKTSYIGEIYTYDFHYNLLILKFKSKVPLLPANVGIIHDDVCLHKSFQLRPHTSKVSPGDPVIVVGRFFCDPFDLMAAPGIFSMDRRDPSIYGCRELFSSSCVFTRCGDGGPVINMSGEVIGLAFFELSRSTPFLPIIVACKWWDHYKKYRKLCHPSYGFDPINVYLAPVHVLERVMTSFPSVSNGVLVEEVVSGSNAELAGLREGDIITTCDGKNVTSFLEFWCLIWDKVGNKVELKVVRFEDCNVLNLDMVVVVDEATPNELNMWPSIYYHR